jgi:hypothetical protein
MLDGVAKNIQAYYPQPNLPGQVVNGIATNNYNYVAPGNSPKRKYFGRFDADVTSRNRITGSAAWNDGPSIPFSPVAPINRSPGDVMNMSGQLSDYWTLSPRTTNELRIGFMGEYDIFTPDTIDKGWPAKLGLQFSKADIFPTITISNYYALGSGLNIPYKENTFDIRPMTLIRGRHLLHFGGDNHPPRRFHCLGQHLWGKPWLHRSLHRGQQQRFARSLQRVRPMRTSCWAMPELGRDSFAGIWRKAEKPRHVFIQDDFKVTPKLTLTLACAGKGHGMVRSRTATSVRGTPMRSTPRRINPARCVT